MPEIRIDPEIAAKAEAAAGAVGVELPEYARRQIANQMHVFILARVLGSLAERFGGEVWGVVAEQSEKLGTDLAPQLQALLGTDADDARSLTRIVDLCNLCLDIVGEEVSIGREEVLRHESECLLSDGLRESGFPEYCRLIFQPMYRGVLKSINPAAGCNDMRCWMSNGDSHCEVITWLGRDHA